MNTSAQTQLSNTPETTNNRFSNRLTANNPRLAHHQTPNTQNPTNTSRKRVETSRQKTKPDSKTQKYTSQTHSQNQKTALKRSAAPRKSPGIIHSLPFRIPRIKKTHPVWVRFFEGDRVLTLLHSSSLCKCHITLQEYILGASHLRMLSQQHQSRWSQQRL